MKSKRRRAESAGTAFVPRIVLKTMMAGLVPAAAAGSTGCVISLAMTAFDATPDQGSDATDSQDTTIGVADAAFDGSIDAGVDATDDTTGPRDSGLIVLAQIGFEVDPSAVRDEQLATRPEPRRRNGSTERAPRRGRA